MKLNQLSKSTAKKSLVLEGIQRINEKAGEELDGILQDMEDIDSDDSLAADLIDTVDTDLDQDIDPDPEIDDLPPEMLDEPSDLSDDQEQAGFTVQNAKDQLNGMVSKWFEIAKSVPNERREAFLKLGDRISEIVQVMESEFINA